MTEHLSPLQHHGYKNDNDLALAREARQHLLRHSPLQLVGELMHELRKLSPDWWSPGQLRHWWPAATRMTWLSQRADLRQNITTELTGLSRKAARRKTPPFQAELLDSVINEGDITELSFELAFDPFDMVVYGPVASVWHRFREQLPLDEDSPNMRGFMAWLLSALITDKNAINGDSRKPVLNACDLRCAIDNATWHTCLPLELRVAIDEARYAQERVHPHRPFHARHELRIAGPDHITAHLPLRALGPALDRAEAAMGFSAEVQETLPLGNAGPVTQPARSQVVSVVTLDSGAVSRQHDKVAC